MKKKITKKLALSKETLRSLEADALRNAAGGATVDRCVTWRYCPNEPNISVNMVC